MRKAIRTVSDLRARCAVKANGCWVWTGCLNRGDDPSVWCVGKGQRTSMGVLICWLKTGRLPEPGTRWFVTCETRCCANPEHRKEGTHAEAATMARSRKTRKFSTLGRQRISLARRKRNTKLDIEKAQEIFYSTEPQKSLARKYGVCQSTVSHIKKGRIWRPLDGASVFTFRP